MHFRQVIGCSLLLASAISLATPNTLIYPISLHWLKGTYYIGDRGIPAILRYPHGKLSIIYQTQDSNKKMNIPIGLNDDGQNSLIIADPGVCALSKLNISSNTLTRFSPPPKTPSTHNCPRFILKQGANHFMFTSFGNQGLVSVDQSGKQTQILSQAFQNPFGITSVESANPAPLIAVANAGKGIISLVQPISFPAGCKETLKYPYNVVKLKNKLYFDDAILNALFSYDLTTQQCVKISSDFKKPLGMTVAGSNIGIIDAGKRALIEYNPTTNSLKTLYQDKTPITTIGQPWDLYVTSQYVYVSDYKNGGILKINKATRALSIVTNPARGTGAPILTAEGLTRADSDFMYLSDGTQGAIFKVNLSNGNHTFFSRSEASQSVMIQDAISMTYYNDKLYVADWAGSNIDTVDSKGHVSILAKLKNPPFNVSSVINGALYFTQPTAGTISKIDLATAKVTKASFNCPKDAKPFGIGAYDKESFFITDAKNNHVLRLYPATGKCVTVTSLSKIIGKEQAWFIKKYDKTHVIVSEFHGNKLFLIDIATGKVTNFR